MPGPRIAITMPTYNSAAYLDAAVESVRAQTFADWELVLVDDGSSDGTVALAEELAWRDARIRVVVADHLGPAAARNRGFSESSPETEFVAFLDSDDTWEPDALRLLVSALERWPAYPAAHGLARGINVDGKPIEEDQLTEMMRDRREVRAGGYVSLPLSAPTSFEAELVQNYVVTPGTSLIRRQVFASLGGFEGAASPAEDWDMNLRIGRRGGFVLVDQVILNWRRHPASLSNTSSRNRRARLVVWRRAITSTENTPEQRQVARWALRDQCRSLRAEAVDKLKAGQAGAAAKTLTLALLHYAILYRPVWQKRA